MRVIRKTVHNHQNYNIYYYFPNFSGGAYREEFRDTTGPDGYTTLSSGCFRWLINIRLIHLLYCQGSICLLEPYFPVVLIVSLVVHNSMSVTPTLCCNLRVTCSRVLENGTISLLAAQELISLCPKRLSTFTCRSNSVPGTIASTL